MDEPEDRDERPSRTQIKREALAITAMGEQLTRLSPNALARLELDEDLVEAVQVCARLKRSARNRQIKRIGKILRSLDHASIREALERSGSR